MHNFLNIFLHVINIQITTGLKVLLRSLNSPIVEHLDPLPPFPTQSGERL